MHLCKDSYNLLKTDCAMYFYMNLENYTKDCACSEFIRGFWKLILADWQPP